MDAAVFKAADAKLEAEAVIGRAARAERTASEVRKYNRELIERMRSMEQQVFGHTHTETQPRPMSSARRARLEARSTFKFCLRG